ncbi:nuclear hormone receptor HR96 isoform X2 [Cloeon dipterum]|uniref:nuclear hormone receptor HR96 isoform X2 n=1 Tax=Cloeon dipterum TaxID=197152 RepID=UPI0032209A8F
MIKSWKRNVWLRSLHDEETQDLIPTWIPTFGLYPEAPASFREAAMSTDSAEDSDVSKGSKVCGVCGDKAFGHNFNAVTCESCKAFFRRNALKNKDFRCPFTGNCSITAVTRRFCQKCRLQKCFDIGMRKDWIMSEEDKHLKKIKIEQNRAKRQDNHKQPDSNRPSKVRKLEEEEDSAGGLVICSPNHSPCPSSPSSSSSVAVSVITSPQPRLEAAEGTLPVPAQPTTGARGTLGLGPLPLLSSLIGPSSVENSSSDSADLVNARTRSSPHADEIKFEPLSPPGLPPLPTAFLATPSPNNDSCSYEAPAERAPPPPQSSSKSAFSPDSIESILSEAIKLEFEAYGARAAANNNRPLNESERAKLNELVVANKALLAPLDDDLNALVGEDSKFSDGQGPMLLDVINLTAIAIRRLIKMAKKISAFKNMCQEDQVALLKGGCTEMMILRSAMTYDPDNAAWKIPHSQERLNVRVDVLKEARGNIYQEHQRFLQTFEAAWRNDESIMLLLGAITLFTPDRANVVHQDVIKLEQNSYYYLLRRYLESKFQGCEARSVFLKLIQKMAELHKLNEDHVRVYLDVNPRDVEPLLIEIFDLKQR